MTINDINENIKQMSDKELAAAYIVGKDLQDRDPKFDKVDMYCLYAIEWEILCRLAEGDYLEF